MMNALVSSEGSEEVGEEGTIRGSGHDEFVRTRLERVEIGKPWRLSARARLIVYRLSGC
jgi:hypothetical protein